MPAVSPMRYFLLDKSDSHIIIKDITEGKCHHYYFVCFSIQILFAEENSELNGNLSINIAERNKGKCTTNICQHKIFFTRLGDLVVECKVSYQLHFIFPWVST